MTDDASQPAADHTPSDFGGVSRNPDGTIEGWKFQEPDAPSREARASTLISDMEHAIQHNAPVTLAMVNEARDLLDVPKPEEAAPAAAVEGE